MYLVLNIEVFFVLFFLWLHTCVNSIKWVWQRSQAVNGDLFGVEASQKTTLPWFCGNVAASSWILSRLFDL